MDALEALHGRASIAALRAPAPEGEALRALLRAASRAPDHGLMRPSQLILLRGEARARLGAAMAEAMRRREPESPEAALERERGKPLRAPLVIVVAARPRERRGVPEVEQLLSAGAAAHAILLAAHALGFGGIWRTGPAAYDPDVKAALGLEPCAAVIGFLYLGTPAGDPPAARPAPDPAVFELSAEGELTPLD